METDVLVPVRPEQEDRVRRESSVGSGSPPFKGMRRRGGRAFVLVVDGERSRIIGFIPIGEVYDESDDPDGWVYRVRGADGVWFRKPVVFPADAGNRQWPTKLKDIEVIKILQLAGYAP